MFAPWAHFFAWHLVVIWAAFTWRVSSAEAEFVLAALPAWVAFGSLKASARKVLLRKIIKVVASHQFEQHTQFLHFSKSWRTVPACFWIFNFLCLGQICCAPDSMERTLHNPEGLPVLAPSDQRTHRQLVLIVVAVWYSVWRARYDGSGSFRVSVHWV